MILQLYTIIQVIVINYIKLFRRLTVIGCECGLVIVAIVNVLELKICKAWKLRYDRPISSVCIFPQQNNIAKPSFLNSRGKYH